MRSLHKSQRKVSAVEGLGWKKIQDIFKLGKVQLLRKRCIVDLNFYNKIFHNNIYVNFK